MLESGCGSGCSVLSQPQTQTKILQALACWQSGNELLLVVILSMLSQVAAVDCMAKQTDVVTSFSRSRINASAPVLMGQLQIRNQAIVLLGSLVR